MTFIYIYVYIYICTYLFICVCINIYIYICIYVYTYICIHIYVYIYIHIYIYIFTLIDPYPSGFKHGINGVYIIHNDWSGVNKKACYNSIPLIVILTIFTYMYTHRCICKHKYTCLNKEVYISVNEYKHI
jgi:hypothetical protein